jgi:hypothetical protein
MRLMLPLTHQSKAEEKVCSKMLRATGKSLNSDKLGMLRCVHSNTKFLYTENHKRGFLPSGHLPQKSNVYAEDSMYKA